MEKGDEAIQAAEDVGNRELAERVRGLQDAVSRVPDWDGRLVSAIISAGKRS